jgi:hypothetical protein
MSPREEKRRAPRIQPFVAPCRYVVGDRRISGFLTDLSSKGGRIHTDAEAPAVGTLLTLEARLGRQATHLSIPATVRWARPGPRGGSLIGMSFDGLDSEVQGVLDGVIDEFRRRAASLE